MGPKILGKLCTVSPTKCSCVHPRRPAAAAGPGPPGSVKSPELGERRSPPPLGFWALRLLPAQLGRLEAGSVGPAASAAPSWVRRHKGAPRWVGPGFGGAGREAHLSQVPGSRNPRAQEKDGFPPSLVSVPFSAHTPGKPRPGGAGTRPRSRSEPGPGGGEEAPRAAGGGRRGAGLRRGPGCCVPGCPTGVRPPPARPPLRAAAAA